MFFFFFVTVVALLIIILVLGLVVCCSFVPFSNDIGESSAVTVSLAVVLSNLISSYLKLLMAISNW